MQLQLVDAQPRGGEAGSTRTTPSSTDQVSLDVSHTTRFRYQQPVTKGRHLLRLRPIHDRTQSLVEHRLSITPFGAIRNFEEAFGNMATRLEITEPHEELQITAESRVVIRATDPFEEFTPDYRQAFPVQWMPWERRMLEPYLEPVELPEAQLVELYEFAQSIAKENDQDVAETLFAINLKMYREFEYRTGSTTLETTPYDVFVNRYGVCQDFANLFICLARLCELPARYVCGYVLPKGDSTIDPVNQATHAWVEIYLPMVGWKGFDPTNGVLASTDHVRVAHGRHYRDATPITGWLEPAVAHDMEVNVVVRAVDGPEKASTGPEPTPNPNASA